MTISMADERRQNIIQAVRDYGKRLFYFIRGRVNTDEDAEDILQDVWYQFSNVLETEPIEQAAPDAAHRLGADGVRPPVDREAVSPSPVSAIRREQRTSRRKASQGACHYLLGI